MFGGFGGFHLPPTVIISHRSGGGSGGSGGGSGPNGNNSGGSGGGSGFNAIVIIAVVLLVLAIVFGLPSCSGCTSGSSASGGSIATSTIEREALPSSAAQATGYYTDEDGTWIGQPSKLESGLKSFYNDTGVWPYVYILPNGQTTSISELQTMAEQLYDELFDDEAHFLLVFCDNGYGGYSCGYAVGSQAKTIMDDEAITILGDYLDRYYNDLSIDEEEIFSKTFEDTGERIMTVQKSPLVPIVVCVTIVVVAGAVVIIVHKRGEQKERERKHTEEVLKTPLEKFGDTDSEAERLAKKYEDGEKSEKGEE